MVGKRKQTKFDNDAAHAENAKHRKIIAEAGIKEQQQEIERLKKEKLLGSLISVKDTQEAFLEIGSKTKAQLARLISTLPPKLEGLPAASMIEIIRESVDEVLTYLADSFAIDTPILETPKDELEDDDEP